ncbi:hypothetical protein MRX96_025916 [Rhipicephalus microplus]
MTHSYQLGVTEDPQKTTRGQLKRYAITGGQCARKPGQNNAASRMPSHKSSRRYAAAGQQTTSGGRGGIRSRRIPPPPRFRYRSVRHVGRTRRSARIAREVRQCS